MQKIKLGKAELLVSSVSKQGYAEHESLEIIFADGVMYAQVAAVYDRPNADPDVLSKLELYVEGIDEDGNPTGVWRQEGVHYGYVTPTDISHFDGTVKVVVKRESDADIRLRQMTQENQSIMSAIAELSMLMMGGM